MSDVSALEYRNPLEVATWDARVHGELDNHASPFFRVNHGIAEARDRDVWQGCFVEDEYGCPTFEQTDVVVDIGAHIGSFACLAVVRGSRRVYAFEPDESAMQAATANAHIFGDVVQVYHAAVVGAGSPAIVNYTPGSMMIGSGSASVRTVTLDDIIAEVGPIRFLKMDCEGSEYTILYTSQRLAEVQQIGGEFHEGAGPQTLRPRGILALREYLRGQGFKVTHTDTRPYGTFHAWRA